MYPISPLYADYLKRLDREFLVKVKINGEDYTNASIVEFSIENNLTLSEGFEIGTAIPSKLTIKLRVKNEIPANAKVIPYLALSLEGMTWLEAVYPWQDMDIPWAAAATEWMPLGEFYVDNREKINDVWTFTCYDKLVFADVAYISQLRYPATQKAVWDEICNRLGFKYDSSVVINPSYQIQAGPAGYTCRQVLSYIAGANVASVYVSKDGIIRFKRFSANDPAVFDMTTADYFRVKLTNPVKSFSRIVVTYNTEDGLTYEAGKGDENHTLQIENPFMTQTMVNNLQAALNGFSYLPLDMDSRGFPHLDQGDIIGFAQQEDSTWLETVTSWADTHIPWDGIVKYKSIILNQVMSFKGGLKLTINAPSVSEQQSEFALEGSLSQQVNRLNQNAVRYGKPYYGITHSRTEGFVVEREDHKSKLTLNSDKMDWQVNGQSTLYYDAWANKLKFNGHLEAASGTFSGDLQAAGGTFTGTLRGVDGVFTGNLSAVGGTFTGTLVGVNGTFSGTVKAGRVEGGEIIGSYIEGADILGSRIKTAAYGDRIELDRDGFVYYDSSNSRRVALGTNTMGGISGHTYYNSSGQPLGLIYALSNDLAVIGNRSLLLAANGGLIYLQGTVQFTGSVIGLNLGIGQISGLESRLAAIEYALNNHTHSVTLPTHNHGNNANQNWGGTFTTSRP
ncbi:hypothetical protein [Paenibacillus azoreducens]|uniref:Prophage tail endopeptidase domain-containing protein n=1 Tax=Paenibacillus azoreducens TaxID=116718 RepID=A0A920CUQ6_9BACL|nr:hypothetical protein [Paenibacillus azoreducens]GIO51565.1 hypothetical protein J34TS1_63300 [Paenibacillus azoreducens]